MHAVAAAPHAADTQAVRIAAGLALCNRPADPDTLGLLDRSVADYAARHAGAPDRPQVRAADGASRTTERRHQAELGWFGVCVPEARGGQALGATAAVVLAEAIGQARLVPPMAGATAAGLLLSCSTRPEAASRLADHLGGVATVLCGMATPPTASPASVAFLVPDAADADAVLLACGEPGGALMVKLLDVPGRPAGVRWTSRTCIDGSDLARVEIDPPSWADLPTVLDGSGAREAWQASTALQQLVDAAQLVGVAHSTFDMALAYLRERHQFGRPIGSFQALQHRASDRHAELSAARALIGEAARAGLGTSRGAWAAAAAFHQAATTARALAEEAVQFHGGIGFADEHAAGAHLRRVVTLGARHADSARSALRSHEPPAWEALGA